VTDEDKISAATVMNSIPEVLWDRCTIGDGEDVVEAFGWIARSDGQRDFVIIQVKHGKPTYFTTSSAKYSRLIGDKLFPETNHVDCQRIEEVFKGMVDNCAVLKDKSECDLVCVNPEVLAEQIEQAKKIMETP
jgi:hypothetical protein